MVEVKKYLPYASVTDIADAIESGAAERRKSGVQPVVAAALPTVADLRDQFVLLIAARKYAPERLTPRAMFVFEAHQRVILEYGSDDEEEIYASTASGHLMRERLREIVPYWFEA